MAKVYCLSERTPLRSRKYDAFRTLSDCKRFVRMNRNLARDLKVFEVEGVLKHDANSPSGNSVVPSQATIILMG